MARDYREMTEEESPPWLLSVDGRPFMRAIGQQKDALLWRMQQAVMTRFPSFGTATSVERLGAERGIPRAVGEDLRTYAGRVRGAWSAWLYAGTATGLLRALYDSGYENAQLAIYNGRRYYLTPGTKALNEVELGPHSWLFRQTTDTYWARFVVLFPEPLLPRWVADGVPGSSSDEANAIRALVRRWKPAHMQCDKILIATSAWTWGYRPDGATWATQGRATWGEEATTWTGWTP